MKKGQITVFIVIGLIIVASMLAFYYAGSQAEEAKLDQQVVSQAEFESASSSLENYVKACTQRAAEEILLVLGAQGGFASLVQTDLTPEYVKFQDFNVPYLAFNKTNSVPPKEFIQVFTINPYVQYKSKDCFANFTAFPGLEVEDTHLIVDSTINENSVEFKVIYPLVIRQQGKEKKLDDFSFSLPVRLGKILDIVNHTVEMHLDFPGYTDVSYMSRQDVQMQVVPHNNDTNIVVLSDANSEVFNQNYYFIFAVTI